MSQKLLSNYKLMKTCKDLRRFIHFSPEMPSRRALPSRLEGTVEWHYRDQHANAFVQYDDTIRIPREGSSEPLRGMSIAVKDNICVKSCEMTCSSGMLKDFVPPYDATVVRLLRDAGASIEGKTNCDEFGMGSHNIHTIHGPVINPYQPPSSDTVDNDKQEHRSAGGSSGGSAAGVASGVCHAALSTDTGGSTRLPAAYCGIVGLKPSYGLISRWGVVSYADSLDCVGIMARGTEIVQRVFEALSVYDPKDPTSIGEDIRTRAGTSCQRRLSSLPSDLKTSLQGLVVGVPQEYFPEELDATATGSLRKLIKSIRSAGAKVIPVSLPSTRFALSAYYVIASAEASSNMARYSGIHFGSRVQPPPEADLKKVSSVYSYTRSKGFGHEVQKRILLGTYALTADAFDNYFLQAQRVRNLVKDDFDLAFRAPNPLVRSPRHTGDVDVLLHPSAVNTAPLLTEAAKMSDLEAYVQDVLTVPASLAGLPAMSVPVGPGRDEWPLGVSIVGQWGHDKMVVKVGEAIESLIKL